MLKKQERLTKAAFDRSFSIGKRFHTPELQVIYHPSPTFSGAAVVGKKVYKTAVARNRLRRQLYGALYRYHTEQSLPGVVILIAKPALKDVPQKQIAPLVQQALASLTW